MDCTHAQGLIDIYLDRELDPVRSLEVEEHLRGCARCAESQGERATLRRNLKNGSLYFTAPSDLQSQIRRSVRQAAKAEAPAHWFSPGWYKIAAPLAAAALVVLIVVPRFLGSSPDELLTQEVVASHIRSMMADHLADVPSTDQHTVKPWFNGKLNFSPPVSDLASAGFPLIGGRLDYLNNRPVAALIYRHEKHVINVFVWPAEQTSSSSTPIKTQQGYQVVRWSRAGMNFWAISDLESNQLAQFTDFLKSSTPAYPG
jgi:anti-sigma factor RsiW